MGVGQASVPAATAVIGYDLATGQIWQQNAGGDRALTGFGVKGSAAAGDTKVSLFIDTVKIGEFFNVSTGFPNRDDTVSIDAYCPAGSQIHIYVDDAPATNPINTLLTWDDM